MVEAYPYSALLYNKKKEKNFKRESRIKWEKLKSQEEIELTKNIICCWPQQKLKMSTQQLKGKGSSKANNNNNKIEFKNSKEERQSSEKKRFNNYAS
jgi:NAD(P)H-flavin reductase